MKKIVLLLSVMICCVAAANAQFFAEYVIKAGIGDPKYEYRDGAKSGFAFKTGFHAGYEFKSKIPVSIGFLYSNNNYDEKRFNGVSNAYRGRTYQSWQIPIQAGYYHDWNKIRVFGNAGLFADYFIDDDIFDSLNGRHYEKRLNLGFLVNAGVGYKLGKKWVLTAAIEYNQLFDNKLKARINGVTGKHTFYGSSNFYGGRVGITLYI